MSRRARIAGAAPVTPRNEGSTMPAKSPDPSAEREARIQEYIALTDWFTTFIDLKVAELSESHPGALGDQYLVSVARQAAMQSDPKKWARLRELETRYSGRVWL